MEARRRPKVLCVDDEPQVLEGLGLHLRRKYEYATAPSGASAIEHLRVHRDVAVIISDMRMPGMNGAELLKQARAIQPDAVRLLLTGHAELEAAVAAVNDGQIFRFLTKPCPPTALMAAVDAAAELHRLMISERVLLEQTLHGCIKTLTDVLALASPLSFGRATRLKSMVTRVAEELGLLDRWQLEIATMLSQLGSMMLPTETAEKVNAGRPLTDDERAMVERMPAVAEQLLKPIPRLEEVREIILTAARAPKPPNAMGEWTSDPIERAAHVLRLAVDWDTLECEGNSMAIATLKGRANRYDPKVLEAFCRVKGSADALSDVREVSLAGLQVGMTTADDLRLTNGTLLASKGYAVTPSFLEKVRNFRPGTMKEPIRVFLATGIFSKAS